VIKSSILFIVLVTTVFLGAGMPSYISFFTRKMNEKYPISDMKDKSEMEKIELRKKK
jgi:hypothetical protein